jgi:hypothetical protein
MHISLRDSTTSSNQKSWWRATAQSKRIRTDQTYTCQVEYPLVDGATIKSSDLTPAFLASIAQHSNMSVRG